MEVFMKKLSRFLAVVLLLMMTVTLLPLPTAAAASLTPTTNGTIVGFGAMEIDEIGMTEKTELSELLEMMPDTITAYLSGQNDPISLSVSWYCLGDYESSDDFYFQFSPAWDTDTYPLAEGLDAELDAPYISVYITRPQSRAAVGNESIIFDYLTQEQGLNAAAACGILANIEAESSFNPQAKCVDTNNKISYGLCQWNGPRYESLKSWCKKNGYDYTTVEGQLHYLTYELETGYQSVLSKMQGVSNTASGAYDAGYLWCYYFEIPANREQRGKARGNLARDTYWARFGANAAEPTLSNATYPGTAMEYGTFFTLRGKLSSSATITAVTAGVYDKSGKAVTSSSATPNSTSYDVYGLDADVLFSQVPAGDYTYIITATANGTKYTVLSYDFTVTPRLLTDVSSASLSNRYTYTAKAITPNPKVVYGKTTLVKGQDYTLSYSDNKKVGTATCTITGIGNYQGVIERTFSIVPKKVLDFQGSSSTEGSVDLTWTPRKTVRGYQVQYSTSSDFSDAERITIVGTTCDQRTLTGLTSGKTYYIRIRSYSKIDGKCYYSFYSDAIKVKVK
jgi:hypothetical protein